MKLEGLKVNFLGDSITFGTGSSAPEFRYPSMLEREQGLAVARNYGIGGTRFARQHTPSNAKWDQDFCSRVEGMDPDADLIVVFGGTNDFGHGDAPMGTFEDRTPDTFYGACHTLMSSLIEKYPTSTIVFITPIHRETEDRLNHNGCRLVDYVDIIKEVARYYSLPVLDLFATAGIQPKLAVQKEALCPDGLHPNDAGYRRITDRLAAFLLAL